ncbi:oxygenase MpaB family protein [Lacihabitans soyangensis]|uniref:DUF2236 domain-containing protein n=1 Tax=Lacihabitans soyangensis TaxID=869394 RepID=A0AAE3H2R1_9BACT|nr:oxygenase MpaB family protein [Lacihabitans soyangensis]MCP9763698.1 DUF2236 domain-containing protein [Lacihabitans soyangensis]
MVKELDVYRQKGDTLADALMQQLFNKHGHKMGGILMPFLSDFDGIDFSQQDEETVAFFSENNLLPDFFDFKEIVRATDFFKKYQINIGIVLGCYSLPYCYLGEDGARVLGFSGRIQSDTYNRLQETGKFVKNVMTLRLWEEKKAIALILKIRLMHAFWRFMILKTGKWDMTWGMPINQEDMMGTNLSFSLIVLRGLKKMGVEIDQVFEKAYYHHWAVVGQLMGISPELLVFDAKSAINLDKAIATRQFKSSEIGVKLTESLSKSYQKMANNELVSDYFNAQTRMFLGEQYADFLGLPPSKYPKALLNTINKTSSLLSNIYA